MKRFTELFRALDATTGTSRKLAALESYFSEAPAADAAWALYVLSGGRLKRLVATGRQREWAAEMAGLPLWMVEECYDAVGDLAETLALLLPDATRRRHWKLSELVAERLQPMAAADEDETKRLLTRTWDELDGDQRLVWNKLITGGFRVGVAKGLAVRAVASVAGLDAAQVAHRLAGDWRPSAEAYRALLDPHESEVEPGRPYPFFLASPLAGEPCELGDRGDWLAEWKWDGIRAQLIRRRGSTLVWSRGEELVTDRFPEIRDAAAALPEGTVVDGEIVAWRDDAPLAFSELQRRLNRKRVGAKLLAEVPCALIAYDLLELDGEDWRERPLQQRRDHLQRVIGGAASAGLRLSSEVAGTSWTELAAARSGARERKVEGLMLKRLGSPYRTGRPRGDWWKWKVDPLTLDAVLIYAQRGHGRRASLYTDYTFAVRHGDGLVPIAKAYSGLADDEIREVDRFVRRNIVERFGPVRSVTPELVFELAFEGIRRSPRHKSGLALRFPRIARWRRDKTAAECDTLEAVRELSERYG
ncbi:MAG: ATP-dependent DNA ligase [Holophagae bacterium]